MIGFDIKRARRASLVALAVAAIGLLAGCGPSQGSSSTSIALTGPADKVHALIDRHKLLNGSVQAHAEALDGGRERTQLDLPKGLPAGQMIDLGKDAMRNGVSFEFNSSSQWNSERPAGARPEGQPARKGGPVA